MRENIKHYVLNEIIEKAFGLIEILNKTDHFSDVNYEILEKINGLLETVNKMDKRLFYYLTLKPITPAEEEEPAKGAYFTIDSTTKY